MSLSSLLKDKPPAERRKLLLLALLAVVFVAVLYRQFSGGSSPMAEAVQPALAQGEPGSTATGHADEQPARVWPTAHLSSVIANNPFRLPAQFVLPEELEPVEEVSEPLAADLPAMEEPVEPPLPAVEPAPFQWPLKVQAVFVDARGAAAMVDSRVVRVGDQWESGARVIEITTDHVTLQRE